MVIINHMKIRNFYFDQGIEGLSVSSMHLPILYKKKWFTTQWHKIDLFLINSAVTAGLGNIVSQKIVKRGKGELVDYRPVIAFSTFG